MAIKLILVPVDFSKPSLEALDYAVEFARPAKAALAVLFVVEPVYYAAPSHLPPPPSLLEEQRRIAQQRLVELGNKLKKQKVKAHCFYQVGNAASTIVQVASKLKAGLIIMSTHGRTGLSHLLIGSVAEKVVRTASCPVMTVRAAKPVKRRAARGTPAKAA